MLNECACACVCVNLYRKIPTIFDWKTITVVVVVLHAVVELYLLSGQFIIVQSHEDIRYNCWNVWLWHTQHQLVLLLFVVVGSFFFYLSILLWSDFPAPLLCVCCVFLLVFVALVVVLFGFRFDWSTLNNRVTIYFTIISMVWTVWICVSLFISFYGRIVSLFECRVMRERKI